MPGFHTTPFLKKVHLRGTRPQIKAKKQQRIKKAVLDIFVTHLQAAIDRVHCRLEACIAQAGAHLESVM